ncbi:hypothetical protein JXA80_03355, partial [bacterium]|nr:hypothetical protein [candidate division CSSED10-310 bacterium]
MKHSRRTIILNSLAWTAGIALLLASQYAFRIHHPYAVPSLVAGAVTLIIAFARYGRNTSVDDPALSPQTATLLLIGILLLALPTRLYHLASVPAGAHNDEIVKGMQVLQFFEGDRFQPFYVANKEFLFFYMLIPFVRFFGISIVGLRALPFTCGMLTIIFTYLAFNRLWGRSVALVISGFLAVGLWPGQSCHLCERLNAAPLFAAAAFFFCILTLQTGRFLSFLGTGLVLGAGMWTFPTFRLIPWAVACLLGGAMIQGTLPWKRSIGKALTAATLFVATATAPLGFNLLDTWIVFYTRHGHDFKIAQGIEQIRGFLHHLVLSFTIDCVQDMTFTSDPMPLFWWPLGAFFLAGLIAAMVRLPRMDSVVIMTWLIAGLIPAMVSEPAVRRLTAAQPVLFGLIGLGIWRTVSALWPGINRSRPWGLIPIAGLILWAGMTNFCTFARDIAPVWRVAWEDYWIVEAVIGTNDRLEVHVDWLEEEAELPMRYLMYPSTGDLNRIRMERPAFSVPFRFEPDRDFVYYFRNIAENLPVIPMLTTIYDDGVLILHQDTDHPRGYYSFTMRKDDLAKRRGVTVSAGDSRVHRVRFDTMQETSAAVGGPDDPLASLDPEAVEWEIEGILLTERHGQYMFAFDAPVDSVLTIDSTIVSGSTAGPSGAPVVCRLTAGAHTVQARVPVSGTRPRVRLQWRTPEDMGRPASLDPPGEPIPAANWLQPPFPDALPAPIPTRRAGFQYCFDSVIRYPHPSGGRSYDIARVESLPDGSFIANCWHYQTMIRLNSRAEMIGEWSANLLADPSWILRFDYDVGPDGNVYIAGDSRHQMLVASPSGDLLRQFPLPDHVTAVHCESTDTLLI